MRRTAANEEGWSLRLEERNKRRPLMTPWQYVGLVLVLSIIAGILMKTGLTER